MAVPYHIHTFEVPTATNAEVIAGVATGKAIEPAALGNLATLAGVEPGAAGLSILADDTATDVRTFLDIEVSTGTGLTGGGNLSADLTIALDGGSIASLALADSALQPGNTLPTALSQIYPASASVAGYRTLGARLLTEIHVRDYGAIGDGTLHTVAEWIIPGALGRYANLAALQVDYPSVTATTDSIDSAAANAALAAGAANKVLLGKGVYVWNKTVVVPRDTVFEGVSVNETLVLRTANYGDTIVVGTDILPAGAFAIRNIWFSHGTFALGNLDHPITGECAHIRVKSCQYSTIENCWFQRLTAGIIWEGGSWHKTCNNLFQGLFDPTNGLAQEGVACVIYRKHATITTPAAPTSWLFTGNQVLGASVLRDVIYSTSTGPVTVNVASGGHAGVGSNYGVLIQSSEDYIINENYFGGPSSAHVAVLLEPGGYAIDGTIGSNFFDGCPQGNHVVCDATGAGANAFIFSLNINNNRMVDAMNSIKVNKNTVSNTPSVYILLIEGNVHKSEVGTPLYLSGALGFRISNNIYTNYNKWNLSSTDDTYVNGVFVSEVSANGVIGGNLCGGGGNTFTTNDNYCYKSITIDRPTSANVSQFANNNVGVVTTFNDQEIAQTHVSFIDLATNLGSAVKRFGRVFAGFLHFGANQTLSSGPGSPENTVTALAGSIHMNTSGGNQNTLMVKANGAGNTGWQGASDLTVAVPAESLAAIGNAVNTENKRNGKLVWNASVGKMYRSRGGTAGDLWDAVDGSGAITPV